MNTVVFVFRIGSVNQSDLEKGVMKELETLGISEEHIIIR